MSDPLAGIDRDRIGGAIVAGGESTRFGGQPKGLCSVGGVRIIDRVRQALESVVYDVVLVANAPDAESWLSGIRVLRDRGTERGSLVGLRTAVAGAGHPVIVVAWDMPFVTSDLLSLLISSTRPGATAVIPDGPRGPEPMCALYTPGCLSEIDSALERRDLRLSSLVSQLHDAVRLGTSDVSAVGDPSRLFFNVNTPADLVVAERMAREA
ncbi:MAG TPA: molybdenum cofactor guanylyltransferase [Gemmatimonadaceae bacterium]|nr:molybdenum cofactor guanylyltransferase [Gemmatimonadaceae bacterium]